MMKPNPHYAELKDSYLFYNIAQKTKAYLEAHPGAYLYRMGIGDVSLPLCDAVIRALHEAVDDQAEKERFHGYMPECGAPFLRKAIAEHYRKRGISLEDEEVFVSRDGADAAEFAVFGGQILVIMCFQRRDNQISDWRIVFDHQNNGVIH